MSDNKKYKKQGKAHPPKAEGRHGQRKKRKGMCLEDRPCLDPNAGGIDIGAREIFVAVPPDRDECPVRVFDTFTEDLQTMACWLRTTTSAADAYCGKARAKYTIAPAKSFV